jgi:hypothetical protein
VGDDGERRQTDLFQPSDLLQLDPKLPCLLRERREDGLLVVVGSGELGYGPFEPIRRLDEPRAGGGDVGLERLGLGGVGLLSHRVRR